MKLYFAGSARSIKMEETLVNYKHFKFRLLSFLYIIENRSQTVKAFEKFYLKKQKFKRRKK